MQIEAGALIGGRYRLDRQIGRGGMGEVWAAKHTVTRRDVALKFLNLDDSTLPQMHQRFLREARAASAVNHPNVIQIQDLFELEDGTPVMVMDLLTGEALGDRLGREGSLPVEVTARIMAPVVSAVGTAHAMGIVHRDLKPENIFLARTGDGEIEVKILDFGIAKLSALETDEAGNITGTGAVLGTPFYMALEQAYGEKDIDHRADIWALGVILYECLAGVRPVVGDNFGQIVKHLSLGQIAPLTQVAPHVPAELADVVTRMLQRDRDDRPRDLREVLPVLRRYTGVSVRTFGGPQAPARISTPEGARGDSHRSLALDDTSADSMNPGTTIEVVTIERAPPKASDSGRRSEPKGSDSGRRSSPRATPAKLRISTGKKASPSDVTLDEGAAAMPASSPPRASRRTALIAVGGVAASIVVTAIVFVMRSQPAPSPAVAPPLESARVVVGAVAVSPTTPTAVAPPPTAEPQPEPSATASSAVTAGSTVRRPGPLPATSAKPPAMAATGTRPAPSAPTATARTGGLVDVPPF